METKLFSSFSFFINITIYFRKLEKWNVNDFEQMYDAVGDLVPFVQLKKRGKTPMAEYCGCFLRFLK